MALASLSFAGLPSKFAVIPLAVGFAAGTGLVATYVTTPAAAAKEPAVVVAALPVATSQAIAPTATEQTPAKPAKKLSCEQQTWPYIDNRCIARGGDVPARKVRLVMAPRAGDAGPSTAAAPSLVSSDGVLRGPDVAPEANAKASAKPEAPVVTKAMRRSDVPRHPKASGEFRRTYSVYSVPGSGSAKPVIVVRPLRLNAYTSRF